MMNRTISDGWHKLCGYDVYVEDGRVLRGVTDDRNHGPRTTWVYRASKFGGYESAGKVTVDAFRAGVRRGTIIMN